MIIQFLWGYYARLSAQPRMKTYFWTCVGPGSGCSGPICQNNCDQREAVQDTIRWLGYHHHSALKYTQCLHFLKWPGYFQCVLNLNVVVVFNSLAGLQINPLHAVIFPGKNVGNLFLFQLLVGQYLELTDKKQVQIAVASTT